MIAVKIFDEGLFEVKNIEKQEGKLITPGPGDPAFVGPVVPEGGPPADATPRRRPPPDES